MKFTLNPDKNTVELIRNAIVKSDGYCPCSLIRDEDHKCICKDATVNCEL